MDDLWSTMLCSAVEFRERIMLIMLLGLVLAMQQSLARPRDVRAVAEEPFLSEVLAHTGSKEENDRLVSWLSYDQTTGTTKTIKRPAVTLPTDKQIAYWHNDGYRHRREIFGEDDRVAVDERLMRRFPFSAVVRISTGCTGTLVSRHHVLTAAHCLYDMANRTFQNDGRFRVGVPIPASKRSIPTYLRVLRFPEKLWPASLFFTFYDVQTAAVPEQWANRMRGFENYDYGLLTLHKSSCIKKPYFKIQAFSISSLQYLRGLGPHTVHFTNFADDKPRGALNYRSCDVEEVDNAGLLYLMCDAIHGSSGAGVYTHVAVQRDGRDATRRRLIGVFSGNRPYLNPNGTWTRLNTLTGMTSDRLREICTWEPGLCNLPDFQDRHGFKSWLLGCKPQRNQSTKSTSLPPTTTTVTMEEHIIQGETAEGSGEDERNT